MNIPIIAGQTIDLSTLLTTDEYKERGTVCMRYPHMILDLMKMPIENRTNKKMCILGPSVMVPSEMYPENTNFTVEVMSPQLSEMRDILIGGNVHLVDSDPEVIAKIDKAESDRLFCYPYGLALDALARADLKDRAKYAVLFEHLKESSRDGHIHLTSTKVSSFVRDIAKKGLEEEKFDFVIATKIIRYPALLTKDGDLKRIDKILLNLFQGLKKNGLLYIDKESLDILSGKAKITLEDLIKRIARLARIKLQHEILEHDVQHRSPSTGEAIIAQLISDPNKQNDKKKLFLHYVSTDHIFKFTRTE